MKYRIEEQIRYQMNLKEYLTKIYTQKVKAGQMTKEEARREIDTIDDTIKTLELARLSPTAEIVEALSELKDTNKDVHIAMLSENTRHITEKQMLQKELDQITKELQRFTRSFANLCPTILEGLKNE
jgi:polyhydroxyalkanoate synthesis regulator phasin